MIRIAYAEDHELVRKGTISLLNSSDIRFIIEASNGQEMLDQLEHAAELPDICIVDISMPAMDGFALVSQLSRRWPQIRVLVLTGYHSELNIVRMIKAGACGYLLKSSSPAEIKLALHIIFTTGFFFTELISKKLIKTVQKLKITDVNFTDREMEFLQYCCSELSYEQIADAMNISARTVHGYCERIFAKFGVNTRMGLILLAIQSGIIPPETSLPNPNQNKLL